MAVVEFQVHREFNCAADELWRALADWRSHGDWIPATRAQVRFGDGGIGTRFVARTGIGPLGFDDNMTVTEFEPATRKATVEKTGPWLRGSAGFEIVDDESGTLLIWREQVVVPLLPQALAASAARLGAALFGHAMGRLARHLQRS